MQVFSLSFTTQGATASASVEAASDNVNQVTIDVFQVSGENGLLVVMSGNEQGAAHAGLPVANDSTKQSGCSIKLMIWVVVKEADLIIHAVDEALQQGHLPFIA